MSVRPGSSCTTTGGASPNRAPWTSATRTASAASIWASTAGASSMAIRPAHRTRDRHEPQSPRPAEPRRRPGRRASAAPAFAAPKGGFQPSWRSLADGYKTPDWFRDAKLGIWSHWGPQCVPEFGDWYGRQMYQQGNPFYEHHVRTVRAPDPVWLHGVHPALEGRALGSGRPDAQVQGRRRPGTSCRWPTTTTTSTCSPAATMPGTRCGRSGARHRRDLGEGRPPGTACSSASPTTGPRLALVADGLRLRRRGPAEGPTATTPSN